MKYLWVLISHILGYKILDYSIPSKEQAFKFCPFINTKVIYNVFEITNDIRATTSYNFVYNNSENTKLTVCNGNLLDSQKGYTSVYETGKKEVYVDNELLTYHNNLYNVLYHEMGHSIGLGHSNKKGIMNYTVVQDSHSNVVDDTFKIWLSQDDVDGINFLSK